MPFGLKNDGACYQRAMNSMFHDFLWKFMQIYIDDIVVKSSPDKDHLDHLQRSFERMRKYGVKMNPVKCAFGVHEGDFLGFIVHKKGIEINQNKTKQRQFWRQNRLRQRKSFNICWEKSTFLEDLFQI